MSAARELRIVVHGAKGRMGLRIIACASESSEIRIVAALDVGDADAWIRTPDGADVIVDFSSDSGAQSAVRAALAKRAALLIGTTALSEKTLALLQEAASSIPILIAPNTSLGVAVAKHLVREAARLLGPRFDVNIVERHHRHKVDSPSGTALLLAGASAEGGLPVELTRIHALRSGDVIGEHLVSFAGPGEVLEVRHAATSRDLFARGALTLASWLASREPGMHTKEQWVAERLSSAKRASA